MKTLKELRQERASALEEAKAIVDKALQEDRKIGENADLTDEEGNAFDALTEKADELQAEIEKMEAAEKRGDRLQAGIASLNQPAPIASVPTMPGASIQDEEKPKMVIPASAFYGHVKNFSAGASANENRERAYRFGMWTLAACGNANAQRFCAGHGIGVSPMTITDSGELIAHTEGVNTAGGYLVPEEFDPDMQTLRDKYGVFRQYARRSIMSRDTKSRPKQTSGLTAYFAGELEAGTESTMGLGNIGLVAKKIIALTTMSSELNEDAAIMIGDELIKEINLAFAAKEDACGFIGDGTSTYGGIVGLQAALTAATAGLVTANSGTNDDWSEVTDGELLSMIGLLPEWAEVNDSDLRWYCSKPFYEGVMNRLKRAAGGSAADDMASSTRKSYAGYEVVTTPVMPKVADTAEVVCAFGSLMLAADFGDRRGTTIAFSNDATVGSVSMFESDGMAVKGTERFDINIHSVGDTSDQGAMVGLLTQA